MSEPFFKAEDCEPECSIHELHDAGEYLDLHKANAKVAPILEELEMHHNVRPTYAELSKRELEWGDAVIQNIDLKKENARLRALLAGTRGEISDVLCSIKAALGEK